MRHSTITLTMDTCGHPFSGQEAETVARFPEMLSDGLEGGRQLKRTPLHLTLAQVVISVLGSRRAANCGKPLLWVALKSSARNEADGCFVRSASLYAIKK